LWISKLISVFRASTEKHHSIEINDIHKWNIYALSSTVKLRWSVGADVVSVYLKKRDVKMSALAISVIFFAMSTLVRMPGETASIATSSRKVSCRFWRRDMENRKDCVPWHPYSRLCIPLGVRLIGNNKDPNR
jgi:hypothetical protein